MKLTLLERYRPSLSRGSSLIHAECPIEQTLRSDDAETQSQLMQEPWSRDYRPEGTLYVADYNGLRLLGRSEGALTAAVEPLLRRFGDRLVVDAPSVRYAFGVPTLEPYMTVLINGSERYQAVVQRDFLRRRGRIKQVQAARAFRSGGGGAPRNLARLRAMASRPDGGMVPCRPVAQPIPADRR